MRLLLALLAAPAFGAPYEIVLEGEEAVRIGTVEIADDGAYEVTLDRGRFEEHFLSMRPFKCVEGARLWCHMPWGYANARNVSGGMTDLEYDLIFVWKDAGDYGIDMWNGIYYRLEPDGAGWLGTLHEIDLNPLAVPPPPGEMRPIRDGWLHEGDPDLHPYPRLRIAPAP